MSIEGDIAAILREVQETRAEVQALREAVARRDEPAELLSTVQLAALLGLTRRALAARLRRGSDLAGLALDVDGRRMWERRTIEAWIARSRPAPRLRNVGGCS